MDETREHYSKYLIGLPALEEVRRLAAAGKALEQKSRRLHQDGVALASRLLRLHQMSERFIRSASAPEG